MPILALDQLRSHLRMTLAKRAKELRHRQWIGVTYRGTPAWEGEQRFTEGGFSFRTCAARSVLEVREQLVRAAGGEEHLVILADLPDARFAADLQSRLLEPEPLDIEPWRVLMAEFGAVKADPRIQRTPDVALSLLQNRPPLGFPTVSTGMLDLGTLWGCVLTHVLGLPSQDPTPRALLAWSGRPDAGRLLRLAGSVVRDQAVAWVQGRSPLAALLLRTAVTIPVVDLIPVGLVCGVVHHPEAVAHPDLIRAQGRIERITGSIKVADREAREWASEAASAVRDLPEEVQTRMRARADVLLADIAAEGFAQLSAVIPAGYQRRIESFAVTLQQFLVMPSVTPAMLLTAANLVREHWDGQQDAHRQAQADMATRLALWLRSAPEPQMDLATALQTYIHVLAWVDWARAVVVGGDPRPSVQQAYQALVDRVRERREMFNRRFGELVATWYRSPKQEGVLPIEDIASRLVAPVAEQQRVLVVVMDGMSWPILQEMLADVEKGFWTLRVTTADGRPFPPPVLSTVPSVTAVARTSLLAGKIAQGGADDEVRLFAHHHALKAASASSNPPVLFHRRSVEEEGRMGLRDDIRDAIANQKQRIVGVVINAIDDHLVKDDMTHRRWDRVDTIRVLPSLLDAARAGKRVVVLCSDHGHVFHLAMQTSVPVAKGDGGERWRTGEPVEGEISITGKRIVGGKAITVPWSERLAYAGKKNGYHGGVTPQELVAPCVVLADRGLELAGWQETHRRPPAWWSLDLDAWVADTHHPSAAIVVATQETFLAPVQPTAPILPTTPEQDVSIPASARWVDALLASETYKQSCAQMGRGRPADEIVRLVLVRLAVGSGGQCSVQSLAEALHQPPIRIAGLVAQIRRLLNRDGYQVLTMTPDRQQVRCDVPLALRQFDIGGVL